MQNFEPDQLVLVRENDAARWRLTHYSHTVEGMDWNVTIDGKVWASPFIISYAGNEHLLGTTDSPTPKWEPKPGESVAVKDREDTSWRARVFANMDEHGRYRCFCSHDENDRYASWEQCEPLRKHFSIPKE